MGAPCTAFLVTVAEETVKICTGQAATAEHGRLGAG